MKINAAKPISCAFETEYLGYTLTRKGIKPQTNKMDSILALTPSTKVNELRTFLGMVQYYRDMWRSCSKMPAPLTDLVSKCGFAKVTKAKGTKKAPLHLDNVHQEAFFFKATIAQDVVLAYLDFSMPFEIYTDASATQLGAVITQDNRPLAFLSKKLLDTQTRYSATKN